MSNSIVEIAVVQIGDKRLITISMPTTIGVLGFALDEEQAKVFLDDLNLFLGDNEKFKQLLIK